MKAEYINPFIDSLSSTFSTMLGCEAQRGELTLADPVNRAFPISGMIGLSGRAVGTVVINLSEQVALKAASAMLMDDLDTVNDDVLDAVGEIANVVAGQAKAQLEEFDLSVSLPSIITGDGHEIRFPSGTAPICVPFETDFGPLRLEVGLQVIEEPAGV